MSRRDARSPKRTDSRDAAREELRRAQAACRYGAHLNPDRLAAALRVGEAPILDVGCAEGLYLRAYWEKGLGGVGIDMLPPSNGTSWGGLACAIADVGSMPFSDGLFRTVTAFEVLEHVDEPEAALAEIARVLRGHLVLSVPNALRYPEHEPAGYTFHHYLDRTHVNFYTVDTLEALLVASGFDVKRLELINPVTPERLVLAQYTLPTLLRRWLEKFLRRIPGRRQRHMTILATARTRQT